MTTAILLKAYQRRGYFISPTETTKAESINLVNSRAAKSNFSLGERKMYQELLLTAPSDVPQADGMK